ncbi:PEP-CTERM sorting domain-containing protein [Granulicella sp. dw_53]|uniref:PEP-CTERM sorting domain-containing protein n=1 Tax=Granulicella sp. dw_53 TaxID=2719792 RepID=UPI001BD62544|nr:PEP-CTERM sorting domain-containing protein [Granulicella sp. dw_53]
MFKFINSSKKSLVKAAFIAFAAAVVTLAIPSSLHASSITYNLVMTGNTGSDFSGTGSFTIASAPVSSGVSTYNQTSPSATISALTFNIDGQTFSLAGATNTLIQFTNGVLTDITFSQEIGLNPFRFALHTTSGYAFYYNNEQSASYGSFTASPASPSPVPEPGSIALLGTGLLGGAATLYRRFGAKSIS